jgi:hypothetical protein
MLQRGAISAVAVAAALATMLFDAQAFDDAKYPDWKGAWMGGWTRRLPGVTGQPSYDQTKSDGRGQQAPLTPEYQAVLEASLANQANGGQGNDPQMTCLPPGMPRMMIGYYPMEIVITPGTTHLLMEHIHNFRRIFTDGRDWPAEIEASFAGYSIGKWVDSKGTGRYDVLEVETRGFKGPRVFDSTGLPLHSDNQTIVKERIYHIRPRSDASVGHDQELQPRPEPAAGLARIHLRGRQSVDQDRQGKLFPERQRRLDADPQRPAAAGPALFQFDDKASGRLTTRTVRSSIEQPLPVRGKRRAGCVG